MCEKFKYSNAFINLYTRTQATKKFKIQELNLQLQRLVFPFKGHKTFHNILHVHVKQPTTTSTLSNLSKQQTQPKSIEELYCEHALGSSLVTLEVEGRSIDSESSSSRNSIGSSMLNHEQRCQLLLPYNALLCSCFSPSFNFITYIKVLGVSTIFYSSYDSILLV